MSTSKLWLAMSLGEFVRESFVTDVVGVPAHQRGSKDTYTIRQPTTGHYKTPSQLEACRNIKHIHIYAHIYMYICNAKMWVAVEWGQIIFPDVVIALEPHPIEAALAILDATSSYLVRSTNQRSTQRICIIERIPGHTTAAASKATQRTRQLMQHF